MKKNILKTISIVLIIVLISLVSFVGIYQKKLNKMENILPKYKLGIDFAGHRAVRLDVDLSTETEYLNEDGSEHVHDDGEEHSHDELTEKEVAVNLPEVLNEENYAKAKEIIKNRLKESGAEEYKIRQDENGYFAIELREDEYTDEYIELLSMQGSFEIKDSETEETLISNNNIKDASAVTYSGDTGAVTVYLIINFDEEGKTKLEEISKIYVETTDEEGNTTTKNVLVTLDDQTIMNTYFGQTMSTGEIQIPIGEATTSNEVLSNYITEAHMLATLLKNGKLPIVYEVGYNNSLTSSITNEMVQTGIITLVIIMAVLVIYLIVKYKVKGLLAGISWIGSLAVLLLVIRYTNCIISANSLVAIAIIYVFEYIFLNAVLNNKQGKTFNEIIIHYTILAIPMYIIALVFAFGNTIPVSSFGMVLFWGSVLMFAYNVLVTKNLIDIEK